MKHKINLHAIYTAFYWFVGIAGLWAFASGTTGMAHHIVPAPDWITAVAGIAIAALSAIRIGHHIAKAFAWSMGKGIADGITKAYTNKYK